MKNLIKIFMIMITIVSFTSLNAYSNDRDQAILFEVGFEFGGGEAEEYCDNKAVFFGLRGRSGEVEAHLGRLNRCGNVAHVIGLGYTLSSQSRGEVDPFYAGITSGVALILDDWSPELNGLMPFNRVFLGTGSKDDLFEGAWTIYGFEKVNHIDFFTLAVGLRMMDDQYTPPEVLPAEDGEDGADGKDGVAGLPGVGGIAGVSGSTGPQGPQGVAGALGPQGPQGEPGGDVGPHDGGGFNIQAHEAHDNGPAHNPHFVTPAHDADHVAHDLGVHGYGNGIPQ